ncbi:MAG: multicopper oxidase domain-containing protein [Nostoc sp.]
MLNSEWISGALNIGSSIAGTFVYHCHILGHEDRGMMAKIQVNQS